MEFKNLSSMIRDDKSYFAIGSSFYPKLRLNSSPWNYRRVPNPKIQDASRSDGKYISLNYSKALYLSQKSKQQ